MNIEKKDLIKLYNKLVDQCNEKLGTNYFKIEKFALQSVKDSVMFYNQSIMMQELLKIGVKRKK